MNAHALRRLSFSLAVVATFIVGSAAGWAQSPPPVEEEPVAEAPVPPPADEAIESQTEGQESQPPADAPPAEPGDEAPPAESEAATQPADAGQQLQFIGAGERGGGPLIVDGVSRRPAGDRFRFWPRTDRPTLAWLAVLVVLALTLRPSQILSIRTLDALALAAVCLLLVLRDDTRELLSTGHSVQWWAHIGLTGAALYWMVRGFALLYASHAPPMAGVLPGGAVLVLAIAGLVIAFHRVATAPLSESGRDALLGGLYVAESGCLPYGEDLLAERHSPLVHLLHAAAVKVLPPKIVADDAGSAELVEWSDRSAWMTDQWPDRVDLASVRAVNAVLLLVLLVSVLIIGQRLYSAECGVTMVAILCVFPGVLDVLTQPDVMLPAALIGLSIALSLLPGFGGLLGMLGFTLAGVAWPWAWAAVPVLGAMCLRRGWQALGGLLGLVIGVATILFGILAMVQPTLPRYEGAVRAAGLEPGYRAQLNADRLLVVEPRTPPDAPASAAMTGWLWRALLATESATFKVGPGDSAAIPATMPAGVASATILYRDIKATADARPVLETAYREALERAGGLEALSAAARTVIEATWLPAMGRTDLPPTPWSIWSGEELIEGRWLQVRRGVKVAAALLVLAAAFALLSRKQPATLRRLAGGLLVALTAAQLATAHGAGGFPALIVPAILTLWAAFDREATPARGPLANGLAQGAGGTAR